MATKGAIVVDTEKCKGCGLCAASCPTGAVKMAKQFNGKGYNFAVLADPDKCTGCTNCATVCPDSVIAVYRTTI